MTESELARAGLEIVEVEIAGAPLHRWQRRATPRWRCLRPGVWACYWLGRYYATARKAWLFFADRNGEVFAAQGWKLRIFSEFPSAPTDYEHFGTLAELRRDFATVKTDSWEFKPPPPMAGEKR